MDTQIAQLALESLDTLNESGYHNTVSLMRGVFLPYNKIGNTNRYKDFIDNKRTLSLENNYIKVTIAKHLLTQIHANILDVIMTKLNPQVSENGRIYVECTLYELQKHLGLKWKNDTEAINKFLSQMVETPISLRRNTSNTSKAPYDFHIIEKFYKDESTDKFIIVLSPDFVNSYFKDTLVNYKPLVDFILSFKYPMNQAIARFLISQGRITIEIEHLFLTIGIDASISRKEKIRIIKNIFQEKDLFAKLGITITRNKKFHYEFHYNKNKKNKKKVYFSNKQNLLNPATEKPQEEL
jgi:hypothetical protein